MKIVSDNLIDIVKIITNICNTLTDLFIDGDRCLFARVMSKYGDKRFELDLPEYAAFYSFDMYHWSNYYKKFIDLSKNNAVILNKRSLLGQTIIAIRELQTSLFRNKQQCSIAKKLLRILDSLELLLTSGRFKDGKL